MFIFCLRKPKQAVSAPMTPLSGRERAVFGVVHFAVSPHGLQQTFQVTVGSELINSSKGTESCSGNETRALQRCPDGHSMDTEWKNNPLSSVEGRRNAGTTDCTVCPYTGYGMTSYRA